MTEQEQRIRELNYDHHSRMTSDYLRRKDESTGENESLRKRDIESFEKLLSNVQGKFNTPVVLELGASNGNIFPEASRLLGTPLTNIHGIDLFEPAVKQAIDAGYQVQCGFIETLPWPDDTFDIIFSRHVMEHTYSVEQTLKEIQRVLRPGGIVLAITPAYQPDPEPAHIQQHSLETWQQYYIDSGFSNVTGYSHYANCPESHIVATYVG